MKIKLGIIKFNLYFDTVKETNSFGRAIHKRISNNPKHIDGTILINIDSDNMEVIMRADLESTEYLNNIINEVKEELKID